MDREPDHVAARQLADAICDLPRQSWSPEVGRGELPPIEGLSFRARPYRMPDREADRVQMRIYFEPLTAPGAGPSWSAWVRCDGDRNDRTAGRLARRFQRAFIPRKVMGWETASGKSAPTFVRTAHWWVAGNAPNERDDITAQIWLFLLQADLISNEGRALAYSWSWRYLERRFKVTDEESVRLLETLLKQFWRTPNSQSWSAYVGRCKYFLPNRVEQRRHLGSRNLASPWCDDFTVSEAAKTLRIPESTLYDRIRRGEIARIPPVPVRNNRQSLIRISVEEVERLRIQPRMKPKALIELRQRVMGSTYEGARKWVWRELKRGRTVAAIAKQLVDTDDC